MALPYRTTASGRTLISVRRCVNQHFWQAADRIYCHRDAFVEKLWWGSRGYNEKRQWNGPRDWFDDVILHCCFVCHIIAYQSFLIVDFCCLLLKSWLIMLIYRPDGEMKIETPKVIMGYLYLTLECQRGQQFLDTKNVHQILFRFCGIWYTVCHVAVGMDLVKVSRVTLLLVSELLIGSQQGIIH